jgi:AcrR family transcriptional regulator
MPSHSVKRRTRNGATRAAWHAGLTDTDIIETALVVLDEDPEGLSLAEIARRLGVQGPSLYSHVSGLTELKRLLRIRVSHDIGHALHLSGLNKREDAGLLSVLGACRAYALRHPNRWLVMTRVTIDADDREFAKAIGHNRAALTPVLRSFGIPPSELGYWESYVWAWAYGYIGFEVAHRDVGFTDARFRRQVADLAEQLARSGARELPPAKRR